MPGQNGPVDNPRGRLDGKGLAAIHRPNRISREPSRLYASQSRRNRRSTGMRPINSLQQPAVLVNGGFGSSRGRAIERSDRKHRHAIVACTVNRASPSSLIRMSLIPAGPMPNLAGPERLPSYVAAAWRRIIEEVDQPGPPCVIAITVWVWKPLGPEPRHPCPSKPWNERPPAIVIGRPAPGFARKPGPPDGGYPQPSTRSVGSPAISDSGNPAIAV